MSLDTLIDRLPHREPFQFVSHLKKMSEGHCVATWTVNGEEWFFKGHFPDNPIVPGVLLTEALAQAGGLAVDTVMEDGQGPVTGVLVANEMRFRQPVMPPASIDLEVQVTRSLGPIHVLNATASVDGTLCAEGTLTLHVGERS